MKAAGLSDPSHGAKSSWKIILGVLLATLAGVTLFEFIEQQLSGNARSWVSSVLTIIFCGLAASVAAYWVLKRQLALQALFRAEILERREAESRSALFAQTLQSISESVSITDMQDTLLHVNQAFLQTYGYSEEELIGKSIAAIRSDRNDPQVTRQILPATLSGGWQGEVWNRRKDGTDFRIFLSTSPVFDAHRKPVALVGIATDLTRRERAQEALRESEKAREESDRRLHELLQTINLLSVMLDQEGRITFCNSYLCRITGWSQEELLGRNWFDLCIEEELRESLKAVFRSSFSSRSIPSHYENSILTRDGQRRLIEWDNTLLRDPDGAIIGSASIGRDITDIRALEERLRQAHKLESVGRLAGGVAHDFNNLMTVINGYSEFLMGRLDPSDPLHSGLSDIRKAGEKAAAITRQLLAFSRKQVLQRKILKLNALVLEAEQLLLRLIGEDIHLVLELDPQLRSVSADADQLHQMLMYLAANARDAMPAGGRLVIRTSNMEIAAPQAAEQQEISPGSYVLLSVTDTGSGLSREARAHLFEPFYTTKEPGKGTGLGLPTVYGIVQQSEGYIRVENAEHQGTTFKILLPAVTESGGMGEPLVEEKKEAKGTEGIQAFTTKVREILEPQRIPRRILIADDEPAIRHLFRDVLRQAGFEIVEAANGKAAMSEVRRAPVDLVITDLVMPEGEGLETIRALRREFPEIKIVAMSGAFGGEFLNPARLMGANATLLKPVSPAKIIETVKKIFGAE